MGPKEQIKVLMFNQATLKLLSSFAYVVFLGVDFAVKVSEMLF